MKIALWIVQILLALMFLRAGFSKTFMPLEELAGQLPWVLEVPAALIRFIGISELAGGLGLILPALTRILPWLTPLAAVGIGIIMVLGGGFHASRGEFPNIIVNIVLLALAAFVAYGRWKLAPIEAR